MFKKIGLLFACLVMFSCKSTSDIGLKSDGIDYSETTLGTSGNFRVGVLLPLTGAVGKYGQGLRNATLMAMEDVQNPNLVLQFYDTKGTESGARIAIENALNNRSQLIIGPLMSTSVAAITPKAISARVPVIAFSTSEDVLQENIYTLGLLIGEQTNRLISYAARKGRERFALLLPDNSTGIAVAKAAIRSAEKHEVKVARIAFYEPNTTDFSKVLREMTDFDRRSNRVKNIKEYLKNLSSKGDETAGISLKRLEPHDSLGDVDFDAVIIPENGPRLKSALSMFGYYDVSAPQVKFLGTSVWESTALNNEYAAKGAWYTTLSRTHSAYFAKKYQDLFGEKPNSLYSLAYDAIALASALAKNKSSDMTGVITNPDGYIGINGVFRLFKNGSNEHSLDIIEIRTDKDMIIDIASRKFDERNHEFDFSSREFVLREDFIAPVITGKDAYAAQRLIFGEPLLPVHQPMTYISAEDDKQITLDALARLKIQIP